MRLLLGQRCHGNYKGMHDDEMTTMMMMMLQMKMILILMTMMMIMLMG